MTSCAELLDHVNPEEHLVQLYGKDDRLLTRNIGRFMSEGLRRGDGLLVIATPEHSGSVARQLRQEPAYSKAVLEGRSGLSRCPGNAGSATWSRAAGSGAIRRVVGEALKGVQEAGGTHRNSRLR